MMCSGFTGRMYKTQMFMCPTRYQKLKHMVIDKIHCAKISHEVLTENGWKYFGEITYEDRIATLRRWRTCI